MKKPLTNKALADFRDMIVQVRGVPVILDSDLARAYGVTTKVLNQAVKRNRLRFPEEFMFVLDPQVLHLWNRYAERKALRRRMKRTVHCLEVCP